MCEAVLRFGFYNIGWQHGDKNRSIQELKKEVLGLVVDHQVQVLGLCEVFDIDDGRNVEKEVASKLVEYLNCAASTRRAAQPALGTWAGVACQHYVTLWRTDLGLSCAEEQSFYCGVPTRNWQRCQYLRFEHADLPQSKLPATGPSHRSWPSESSAEQPVMRFATALKQPHHSLSLHVCEAVHWFDLYNIGWQHGEGLNEEDKWPEQVTLWRTDLGFSCAEEQSVYCWVPTRDKAFAWRSRPASSAGAHMKYIYLYICININNCSRFVSKKAVVSLAPGWNSHTEKTQ